MSREMGAGFLPGPATPRRPPPGPNSDSGPGEHPELCSLTFMQCLPRLSEVDSLFPCTCDVCCSRSGLYLSPLFCHNLGIYHTLPIFGINVSDNKLYP